MTERLSFRDVLALVGLSFFSGLFAALVVFCVVILAKWEGPLTWSGVTFVVVACYSWWWLVRRWHPDTNQNNSENFQSYQIPDRVRVDLIDKTDPPYFEGAFIDMPGSKAILSNLGSQLIESGDFSMAALSGPGKLFSRSEFEALRSVWLKANLVKWRNENAHSQGMQLTSKGKACARIFASWSGRPPSLRGSTVEPQQQNVETRAGARERTGDFDYSHYDHAELK